jgi:ATP-dependent RNA helicase DDX24/MAK5
VNDIKHVLHYELPRSTEVYVHRCGRSGRAQREGFSLAIVSPNEKRAYLEICKATNKSKYFHFK